MSKVMISPKSSRYTVHSGPTANSGLGILSNIFVLGLKVRRVSTSSGESSSPAPCLTAAADQDLPKLDEHTTVDTAWEGVSNQSHVN